MTGKLENQATTIITTHGTDGACSAALLLQMYPKAEILITSARRIALTLDDIHENQEKPSTIYICGVGFSDNLEPVVNTLQSLRKKRWNAIWYCGRKYLDPYRSQLKTVCEPIFLDCQSNTEAIFKHNKIRRNDRVDLLRTLAGQFVDSSLPRTEDQQFWHDLLAANASRYFKYEDRRSFIHAIQKLACLLPISDSDRKDVELYRTSGKYSIPLGDSKPIKKLRQMIQRLAPLDEPVLVIGPTGSGKEVCARLLHEASQRNGFFVSVNCAVLSTNQDLAHDRLFGHVMGAFTGAHTSQPGAFEVADQGTLFLDEIAELPLQVQTQLLRVLEEGSITPLGTMKSYPVHVRIVAATNQDLPGMIQERRFRMDLYHRLNVLTLRVPTLQERQEDMKSIAKSVGYELQKKGYTLHLSSADWKAIHQFPWQGNIRQFINLLKRSAYLEMPIRLILEEENQCYPQDTSWNETSPFRKNHRLFLPTDPQTVLPEAEIRRIYIHHVFQLFEGNITRTAEALQVSVNTLKKWLKNS